MSDEVVQLLREIQRDQAEMKGDVRELKGDVAEVKTEVKATNGRVTKLEMWRYGLEQIKATRSWRWPAVVGIASGVTVTVLGTILALVINAI